VSGNGTDFDPLDLGRVSEVNEEGAFDALLDTMEQDMGNSNMDFGLGELNGNDWEDDEGINF
jgi:hypothetical protein